jgi:Ketopantoate reductase PanE/ApbA C terminal
MSGVLYIGAERVAPGVIECSTDARITFGPYDGRTTEPMWAPLQQMLTAAGVTCTIDEHIRAAKWQKFLFNCGLNPLTALTRRKLGSICAEPARQGLFEGLIDEAVSAVLASGGPWPPTRSSRCSRRRARSTSRRPWQRTSRTPSPWSSTCSPATSSAWRGPTRRRPNAGGGARLPARAGRVRRLGTPRQHLPSSEGTDMTIAPGRRRVRSPPHSSPADSSTGCSGSMAEP